MAVAHFIGSIPEGRSEIKPQICFAFFLAKNSCNPELMFFLVCSLGWSPVLAVLPQVPVTAARRATNLPSFNLWAIFPIESLGWTVVTM